MLLHLGYEYLTARRSHAQARATNDEHEDLLSPCVRERIIHTVGMGELWDTGTNYRLVKTVPQQNTDTFGTLSTTCAKGYQRFKGSMAWPWQKDTPPTSAAV